MINLSVKTESLYDKDRYFKNEKTGEILSEFQWLFHRGFGNLEELDFMQQVDIDSEQQR